MPDAVRLWVRPQSSVLWHLVLHRGIKTLAILGTWTPQRGWDLTAAGCQAPRLLRVMPAVLARQSMREDWFPRGEAGAAPWDGGSRAAARISGNGAAGRH